MKLLLKMKEKKNLELYDKINQLNKQIDNLRIKNVNVK